MDTRGQQLRNWCMLCHLSALANLIVPFGNILGPLIVWQIKKNEFPEIDMHGKESLNFQLTVLIVTFVFSLFLFDSAGYSILFRRPFIMLMEVPGLGMISVIQVVSWIFVIIATVRAGHGELFRYPCIRFIR